MARNINEIWKTLVSHILLAKQSGYNFKYKIKIYNTLNSLYIKSLIYKTKREVTQNIFNFKVTAYEYSNLLYLFKEIFILKEYYFKTEKLNPTIVDCGANIGMSILYFKYLYPNSSIIAFEPNPTALLLLKKNVFQNNLLDVDIKEIALSKIDGTISLYTRGDKALLLASIIKERGGENILSTQSKRLSDLIGNNVFDLIKIDIEGAESEVIEDLYSMNKINNSEKYIIEYHHRINIKNSLADFIKPFEECRFGFNIKASFRKIGGIQNILFYIFKE